MVLGGFSNKQCLELQEQGTGAAPLTDADPTELGVRAHRQGCKDVGQAEREAGKDRNKMTGLLSLAAINWADSLFLRHVLDYEAGESGVPTDIVLSSCRLNWRREDSARSS